MAHEGIRLFNVHVKVNLSHIVVFSCPVLQVCAKSCAPMCSFLALTYNPILYALMITVFS